MADLLLSINTLELEAKRLLEQEGFTAYERLRIVPLIESGELCLGIQDDTKISWVNVPRADLDLSIDDFSEQYLRPAVKRLISEHAD